MKSHDLNSLTLITAKAGEAIELRRAALSTPPPAPGRDDGAYLPPPLGGEGGGK